MHLTTFKLFWRNTFKLCSGNAYCNTKRVTAKSMLLNEILTNYQTLDNWLRRGGYTQMRLTSFTNNVARMLTIPNGYPVATGILPHICTLAVPLNINPCRSIRKAWVSEKVPHAPVLLEVWWLRYFCVVGLAKALWSVEGCGLFLQHILCSSTMFPI